MGSLRRSLHGGHCKAQRHLLVGFSFMGQKSPEGRPGKSSGLGAALRALTGFHVPNASAALTEMQGTPRGVDFSMGHIAEGKKNQMK